MELEVSHAPGLVTKQGHAAAGEQAATRRPRAPRGGFGTGRRPGRFSARVCRLDSHVAVGSCVAKPKHTFGVRPRGFLVFL